MAKILFLLLMVTTFFSMAQPGTEVYLFDLKKSGTSWEVSNPKNISNNPGYDNQPSFSSNGDFLYYTSWQENDQTDIIQYQLALGERRKISDSEGSEYSPIEMPKGKKVSTIILERDGEQLLTSYDLKTGSREVIVPDLTIGYHCWLDKKTLFSFVLGAPPTLLRTNVKKNEHTVLAKKIGRSLHKIPDEKAISFISKAEKEWKIMKYEAQSGKVTMIARTQKGSEDMCWTPTREVIMGKNDKLYILTLGSEWQLLADFSKFDLTGITRLAVNNAGTQLAVVVNE